MSTHAVHLEALLIHSFSHTYIMSKREFSHLRVSTTYKQELVLMFIKIVLEKQNNFKEQQPT